MNQIIKTIKAKRPLIHHITNQVSMAFQANACTALGASPIMASHPDEVAIITHQADALLLNLGTPTDLAYSAAFSALAAHGSHSIVLDPVGVGISPTRRQVCLKMLEIGKITVLKGNAGEIAALSGIQRFAHGVDSKPHTDREIVAQMAADLSKKYQTIVVMTGETDLIVAASQGKSTSVGGGHPWITAISGSGCVLGTIIASFLAVDPAQPYQQTEAAVRFYRDCVQQAAEKSSHFGEFPQYLMTTLRSVEIE